MSFIEIQYNNGHRRFININQIIDAYKYDDGTLELTFASGNSEPVSDYNDNNDYRTIADKREYSGEIAAQIERALLSHSKWKIKEE